MAQTATTSLQQPLPPPTQRWFDPATGRPTLEFSKWASQVDAILRAAQFGVLLNAANDAAAQAAGVPVNGFYRTGNAVQIRLV